MDQLIHDFKSLIIGSLMLEDVSPEDIETDAPLFRDGLGLDSIDALELAMAIHERYGVRINASHEENRKIFASVRSLTDFIAANRSEDQPG